ncbi:MAG: electron transfer flavoprotein subunit alpha/FixB family protein [Myxococcales bacterium]|nr:electron transfer flavoprotein subunit alpha/FixB family protein [Myxococcales bacterium]
MTDVLVVAELHEGSNRKTTLSAITFAAQVASGTGGAFDILAIGEGSGAAAEQLAGFGARKILKTEIAGGFFAEAYAATVAKAAEGYGVIAATASSYGKDLLTRVAAKLEAGTAPDISAVSTEGGELVYTRPMYAGNVIGKMKVLTDVQVVTVRQTEFAAASAAGGSSPIEDFAAVTDPIAERIELLGLETVESERPDLAEAEVVVAGGRALKSAENFENVLEPLADALGAAVGASRAACDAGYVAADLQIGQTGKVVAPKLYVAIGISGAIQHLAGMKGSKVIVAINKDKEAPIAQVADYFLAQDLFEAIPQMTSEIKKIKAAG